MASSSPPTSLASSFSSVTCLNSISGLFSILDLNHYKTRKMGDLNNDLIVEVPDTPDRLVAQQNNKGKCVWKETHSSLQDGKTMNGFRGIGRLVNENDHKRNLFKSRKNHVFNDVQDRGESINLSSPENSHASLNHHYRKASSDKPSNLEKGKSIGVQNMDSVRSKIIPSVGKESNSYLDVKRQNIYSSKSEIVSENGVSRAFQLENVAKDSPSYGESSSTLHILDSPKQSSNVFHGKEKVDGNTSQDHCLSVPPRKVIQNSTDGRYKFEKLVPEPHCNLESTRTSGRKRLVRNGCISPHNIAMKAKQLVKQESSDSKIVLHSLPGNTQPLASSCHFDLSDIVSEGIHLNKDKGKGVIVHPSTFQAYDTRNASFDANMERIHGSSSYTAGDTGKGDVELETSQRFKEFGGWRSTRSRSLRIDHPLSDPSGVSSQMKSNNITRCDSECGLEGHDIARNKSQNIQNHGGNTEANYRDFRFMSNLHQITEPNRTEKELSKRQKKQGSASINNSKCSVSDIICLDSPGEPSNSRSSRIQGRQSRSRNTLRDPNVGFSKLSPGMARPVSQEFLYPNNDESDDARLRQLEADEKLARELQEQLYHDLPFIEFNEFDENIALALQQEEESFLASSGAIRRASQTRRQPMVHSRRQPRSRSFQTATNRDRSGIQRRASNYNRVDLRRRFSGSSSRVSSRDRGLRFPLDMDLDMRIDILEALEAAVGDDLNDTRVSNHIFQLHHDFNDADYEMLLTLDDNNHCHAGASVNQINSLPQSTVQTENFEEACAICLETPTTGDTIRHLPCFHKFHKECIDPWLRRKTSCPVCKFSIT